MTSKHVEAALKIANKVGEAMLRDDVYAEMVRSLAPKLSLLLVAVAVRGAELGGVFSQATRKMVSTRACACWPKLPARQHCPSQRRRPASWASAAARIIGGVSAMTIA